MPTLTYPPRVIVRQEVVGSSVPLSIPTQPVVLVGPNNIVKYRELAEEEYTGTSIAITYPDITSGAVVDTSSVYVWAYFSDPNGLIRVYDVNDDVTPASSYITIPASLNIKYEVEGGSRGRLSTADFTTTYSKYFKLYSASTSDTTLVVSGNVAAEFKVGSSIVTPYIYIVTQSGNLTGYYRVTNAVYGAPNTTITVDAAGFTGFDSSGTATFYPVQTSTLRETDTTFSAVVQDDELVLSDGYYAGTYDILRIAADSASAYADYCTYVYKSSSDTWSGSTLTTDSGDLDDYIKVNDRVWVIDASGTNTSSFRVVDVSPNKVYLSGSVDSVSGYFVVGRYIQISTSIDYAINHATTVGSADVESSKFLVSYNALRTDSANTLLEVTSVQDAYDVLGLAVPENPLGLAAYVSVSSSTYPVYCMRISTNDYNGYANSESALQGLDGPYYIVPLSHLTTVHSLFKTHASQMAGDNYQMERMVLVNRALTTYTSTVDGTTDASFDVVSTDELDVTDDIRDYVAAAYNVYVTYHDADGYEVSDTLTVSSYSYSGGVTTLVLTEEFSDYLLFNADSARTWEIRTPVLSKTGQASYIADYARTMLLKRITLVWPDYVKFSYTVNEGGDDPYADASTSYDNVQIGGYYACAEVAALAASRSDPSRPMNRITLSSFSGAVHTNGYFTSYDLNVMAGGGVMILTTQSDTGPLIIRDQLTTDPSSEETIQFSSVTALDYGAMLLRSTIMPLAGVYKQDDEFNSKLTMYLNSCIQSLLTDKIWKDAQVLSITTSGSTVSVSIKVTLYGVAKTIIITLKV